VSEIIEATWTTVEPEWRIVSRATCALAKYRANTDEVTFDWPAIEREAQDEGSSVRGLAKILLAARAAGGGSA
jgi:hypothetical protein